MASKRYFWAISPKGEKTLEVGVSTFAKANGLDKSSIFKVLRGDERTHRGWSFEDLTDEDKKEHVETIEKLQENDPLAGDPDEPREQNRKPPPKVINEDGTFDPDLIRRRIREGLFSLAERQRKIDQGRLEAPARWNPERAIKLYKAEAEAAGIDWRNIEDTRTPEEKALDAAETMISSDPQELFAQVDEVLDVLEKGMVQIQTYAAEYLAGRREQFERKFGKSADPKEIATKAELMQNRLRRVIRLRKLAKEPCPSDWMTWYCEQDGRFICEGTHALRYMLYVGRSDFEGKGADRVFKIARHHVKMSMDLYVARSDVHITDETILYPGDIYHFAGGDAEFPGVGYDGAMLLYPPRHSKTAFLRHQMALWISRNPRTQGAYLHSRDVEAQACRAYVASCFDANEQTGRRNLSLHPGLEFAKRDNNASKMRLKVDDSPKNPNLIACSIWADAQGNNLDWIVADDVVPQDDRDQPTQRERRLERFAGTWLTRFQGGKRFYIISGYPAHHDDLVWRFHQQAKRAHETRGREGTKLLVSKQAVGGPKSSPPFKPIWPEVYSQKVLRATYRSINNASIWAANYELNPITDDMKIVREVKLYDPAPVDDPDRHTRFLRTAEYHLSLDPAFTKEARSDKAGLVLLAMGNIDERRVREDGTTTLTSRQVIRVIMAEEVHATQSDLAEIVGNMANTQRIDLCHVEVVGGSQALPEMLRNQFGITSIIEHRPGPVNKERRLRGVASMLENALPGVEAVVEFPGKRSDDKVDELTGVVTPGKLYPDDRVSKLINYIVNFRVTTGHHSMDALTQACKYLAPHVGIGEGAVTSQVRRHTEQTGRRVRQHLDGVLKQATQRREGNLDPEMRGFTAGFGV